VDHPLVETITNAWDIFWLSLSILFQEVNDWGQCSCSIRWVVSLRSNNPEKAVWKWRNIVLPKITHELSQAAVKAMSVGRLELDPSYPHVKKWERISKHCWIERNQGNGGIVIIDVKLRKFQITRKIWNGWWPNQAEAERSRRARFIIGKLARTAAAKCWKRVN